MRRSRLALVGLAALTSFGATCAKTSITAPREAQILPEPSVRGAATIERTYDAASVVVTIDGVDVTAAVGLAPPFADAGAVVLVGGVPVTVSDFDFTVVPSNPFGVSLVFTGLPEGAHQLGVTATPAAGGAPVVLVRSFVTVEGFADAAREQPAGALAAPVFGGGGRHRVASIGGDPAGAAVPFPDGGTHKPGFVPVAEQLR